MSQALFSGWLVLQILGGWRFTKVVFLTVKRDAIGLYCLLKVSQTRRFWSLLFVKGKLLDDLLEFALVFQVYRCVDFHHLHVFGTFSGLSARFHFGISWTIPETYSNYHD